MDETTSGAVRWFAAVDAGVASGEQGTGAVYGIGLTPESAIADARWRGPVGCRAAALDAVPCSREAAELIMEHGGAPGVVRVTRTGVTTREG